MPGSVLAAVDDLFFLVQIKDAAAKAGFDFALAAKTGEALAGQVRESKPELLVMDLNARAWAPTADTIRALKTDPTTSGTRILAFVPHVQVDLRREAVEAGADHVSAKSAFAASLERVLGATREARDN